jgi:drug/metabolite transporter (DMT)-like permease
VDRPAAPASTRSWLPAFVCLSAIWGSSFALIKIAVEAGVPALWVSLVRCALGATALWAMLAMQRQSGPTDGRLWLHAGVAAALLNSMPFTLIAYGEAHISSVLAGVLTAGTPLFTLAVMMLALPGERPSPRRLAGVVVGLLGVLVVVDVSGSTSSIRLLGGLAVLAAAACYGAGYAYTRRHLSGRPESGTVLSTAQVTLAALQLGLVAPVADGVPSWPGTSAAAALVALGVLGTGLAYVLNMTVIRRAGPAVASTVTYVVPLWSTVLGGLVLTERVGWNVVAGGLLIIVGVAVSRGGRPDRGQESPGQESATNRRLLRRTRQ